MNPPLVVFSHLRWDFVYQRPQHLLSRLAEHYRIVFVEEPVFDPDHPYRWEGDEPCAGLRVYRPHSPERAGGFVPQQEGHLGPLLKALVQKENLYGAVAWLYTPMALPLIEHVDPVAVVYDRMDALAQFAFAPPEMTRREDALLERADLVFTGGPSLYESVKGRNPNLYCFPSSVDAEHFGQAKGPVPEPDDQAPIGRPRLGYFGVIDERMDLRVLHALATAHPEWQIVMVGPVAKVDPEALPRARNIHYLGQKRYEDLPAYLAGWDACLLPFAMNEATEFISPTKTLEYMAAEKPIVSTPVRDVADLYRDAVYLADTPGAFVAACEDALGASAPEREARATRMRAVLATTSWVKTAAHMHALLRQTLLARQPAVLTGSNGSAHRAAAA